MSDGALNPVVLSNVVKLVGVVATWGATIFFVWVKKPPPVIASEPFFDQIRRIAMLVISVFLILSWGLLGNTGSLRTLFGISLALTSSGIVVFFVVVAMVERWQRRDAAKRSKLGLLLGFFFYTTTISVGLTSAVEFLAVILLNPTNAVSGQAVVSNRVFSATAVVSGNVDVAQDQEAPFRVSSGQRNLGCNETIQATAIFNLPPDSHLVGGAVARWENISNLSRMAAAAPQEIGGNVVASGTATGLPYQEFALGIRNCPGGGHGELVLTGTYKSTIKQRQPKSAELRSIVSSDGKGPVWVSLPSEVKIDSIKVVFSSITDPKAPNVTLTVSPESPVAQSDDGKLKAELQVAQGRLGLSVSS